MRDSTGIFVMAYGTPRGPDDVEAYYTDIRHGRPPSPDLLDELRGRYEAIGGRSPLLELTLAQAKGISGRVGAPAYVGLKHAPPFIADAVEELKNDGIERAVGLVLAPHYSTMSIGDYARRAHKAAEDTGWSGKLEMIESWHLEPGYIDYLAREVDKALGTLPSETRARAVVLFTAHSLPERILQAGDPYPRQLEETGRAVAAKAKIEHWQIGWQSAGRTEVPWLGPDLLEILERLATEEVKGVVVCPCGFVADHLEVLYDIDIEAQKVAHDLGLALVRTASPNTDELFLDTLATVVLNALSS